MQKKYFSLIVLSSLLLLLSSSVSGAIFTVTKAVDTNDGVCDSDCSLREAVAAANAGSDADDVIVFSPVVSDVPFDMNNGEMQILSGNSIAILGFGAYEYLSTAPAVKSVSVGGQVVSATGVPFFRASVTLIDTHGVAHPALTNSFGFYSFPNIAPDEYCALIVSAKRGRFKMQVINSGLGLSNVNFASN